MMYFYRHNIFWTPSIISG